MNRWWLRWLLVATVAMTACGDGVPLGTTGPPSTITADTTADVSIPSVPPPPGPEVPPTSDLPAATGLPPATSLPAGRDTTVEEIVDGDTIIVAAGERVRLIGIDTPETKDPRVPVQCFGQEASDRAAELLPAGTGVHLVSDIEPFDRYGRSLAYVYRLSDGLFVNAVLVSDGYASAVTYPPNVAHAEDLVALAAEARDGGRGLWGACGGTPTAAPTTTVAPPP